ncbi:OmpA family protein [Flaviramulus aquimarinus]|uniref:OmpA family protein n=1 Tax=Flaviramulus aquimarinus TaxID=1170456 RepID=A0ABP9F8T7_9FLAO
MKIKFLILILAFSTSSMFAQKKLADKFFDNYAYVKASELYEKAIENGDDSQHVLTRLGDCYYNNSNSEKAVVWYSKAVNKYDKIPAEYLFKYIQTLKSLGNYTEADIWMKKFNDIHNQDSKTKNYDTSSFTKYSELLSNDDKTVIKIVNLPINSNLSDFGSYIHNNQLFFASSKGTDETEKYAWNKEPFLDLFQVSVEDKEGELEFGVPNFINASKVNTDYHEATVAISNDGQTLYFTRDNVTRKNKLDYDNKGTTHLKIYKATRIEDSWSDIKELPFNDEVYSTGHPALSSDNKKLYFVSDREGGFGQTDIYEVDILENNKFSKPKNLGNKINTAGREMFPFVSKDSTFYFSSDGHLNLGLLDIFKSNIIKDQAAEPENLGAPYNSGYDDFAFYADSNDVNNRGYFSSNRPGGQGNDDIYSFTSYECSQKITGIVRDSDTNEILENAVVKLINETGKVINEVTTSSDGAYTFDADCNKTYVVLGTKPDYKDEKKELVLGNKNNEITNADLYLEPLIKGNQIVINPIFFDFDKWNIRTDAEYELEKVIDVLRAHPGMIIKVESHTDSRGSNRYNMKLSDRRAKSSTEYITSRGIDNNRIESSIGYGENQLLNKCVDGVKCTPDEHQLNRRTQFIIIKMD